MVWPPVGYGEADVPLLAAEAFEQKRLIDNAPLSGGNRGSRTYLQGRLALLDVKGRMTAKTVGRRQAWANLARLRDFVGEVTRLIDRHPDEPALLAALTPLLARLIAVDDWLPEDCALPVPERYRQYLLHADPLERLSVVSFVWGPGQRTPIHDHRVWGLVGVLRGAELSTSYHRGEDGRLAAAPQQRIARGEVVAVSPDLGDIHSIANALPDQPSISIHVYGGNIGAIRRATFFPQTGARRGFFISGYSNSRIPNLWDRSAEAS